MKNGPSQSSPVSVIPKTLFADIDLNYEALAGDSLFVLLKDLKWKMAASRIAQFQDESCRWVVDHDDKNKKMIFRRLPIHEACIRNPTVEVVAALLDSYPTGASAKDNHGRTPLHCAVIHGAHIDVVYLLMNASYDVVQSQDFFNKIPQDYAHTTTFTNKAEVIAALTEMSKEDVSLSAAGVQAAIRASHPMRGDRSGMVEETTKQVISTYDEAAEQLSQALVDADAANTLRSIAIANEEASKVQVKNLQSQVIGIKKQLERERENKERSENCIFLLEKKQETFIASLTKRDEEIKILKEQTQRDKQQRHSDAVMRQKLKKTVSNLTERLDGNDEESVEYWKVEAERLIGLNVQASEKQHSLEQLLQVYMDRSHDLEEKLNSSKEQLNNNETQVHVGEVLGKDPQKTKSVHSKTAVQTTDIDKLLENAESALEASGQKVIALEEDINKSYDENDALKSIIENYHSKLSHLETSFYDLSGHLLKKSEQLSIANSDLKKVDEERMKLIRQRQTAEKRIESLESLIGEYSTDHQDSKELTEMSHKANEKIRELEDIIMEYDQENHSLDEKCSSYEKELSEFIEYRAMAAEELDSLHQHLLKRDVESKKIEEQCILYRDKLESCNSESERKISSLEDLVRMYRQKSEKVEEYRVKAKQVASIVIRLEEDIARIRMDRSKLKKELAKACQKNGNLSTSVRYLKDFSKDLNSQTKNLERSHFKATEQLIDRTIRSSIPPTTARKMRTPLSRRIDNSDCMSVCSQASSVVSCNSVTSAQSARSASSSNSRRSTALALRTQRALKHRISTRNNAMSSSFN